MALFRKLFYKKPPDGLLEISEKVYVFDCCFTTDAWDQESYKGYVGNIVSQLKDHYPDASILIFNFRKGDIPSQLASALSNYDMTIVEYPLLYEGCPLLSMEVIHHCLRSCESWLSLGLQNVLLMHCERGGWPVLAFMLAALLIYRKYYTGESKTLDMVYKQAPSELLHLFSPLNPLPSQLRYLQYVSRRNVATEWPPLDRALSLDCVIMRMIPDIDGNGGCCPIFRIFGQDPYMPGDKTTKLLFSTPKTSKNVRHYKQAECELVIIDIDCHIQGDIVLECMSLHDDLEHENMMYRAMFNTSFIRSNILILNRDEIDVLWDAKDQYPMDFKAEFLFSEMDAAASVVPEYSFCFEEEGLPIEAFAKVQEMFSSVDWLVPRSDATFNVLHQIAASDHEQMETSSHQGVEGSNLFHVMTPRMYQDKESIGSLENDPNSSVYLAKEKSSSDSPSLPSPQTYPSKNLVTADVEVRTLPPQLPSPTSTPTQSAFPPSMLPPSSPLKGMDTKAGPSRTLPSPSGPVTPLKEKRDTEDQAIRTGETSASPCAPPASPPPSPPTPPLKEKLAITGASSPPRPRTPPTPPLQEKPAMKAETSPPPPPPPTASMNEKPATTAGPSPPPPPPTAPMEEKPATTAGPFPPPSPPTAPMTEKPATTAGLSPPPPPPTAPIIEKPATTAGPPPPPPPPLAPMKEKPEVMAGPSLPPPPPPPPPPTAPVNEKPAVTTGPFPPPPPLPPPPPTASMEEKPAPTAGPFPPPPPPPPRSASSAPPPPPPPAPYSSASQISSNPPPPPPPLSSAQGGVVPPPPPPSLSRGANASGAPAPPPFLARGRGLSQAMASKNQQAKKLKPLHWLKLTRAVQGSLWAETQKSGEAVKTPEIDISELENLFSAAIPSSDKEAPKSKSASKANKPEKVQLIDHRRAYNCEIMLSKVKIPLHELMDYVLALDESALDVDQVDNLIKFCPTKEEMELLKGYKGERDKLGKCEQFFMELMKVPRTESKLRVFSFKLQFGSQVSDLRKSLNSVNTAVEQVRSSSKFKRVMQTILTLGNALNQGTARGAAVGFRLDSLLKLTDTRARNKRMTLMHYLCKVLEDKLPELLDFSKDLDSLEPASKVQLKYLAEEMQVISKGLEKVVQELSMAENDGPVSENFRKALKEFLCSAEGEARSLALLYSAVGKNVDALILYFGEDPARCPYEHVVSTLRNFVRMFNQAHEENIKQQEAEKKKAVKEASKETSKPSDSNIESEQIINSPKAVK
ncbi:formin-like protein 13 [Cynara cardunculus var. scolymus]|uniref:formin-like protein 13 n=1 Tax=Cynara cardunculus var. scolymus TaxID=59895 RepID=UPI000D62B312|nr:formin-like protein 13 [Cynara cardunculus var. scolymus]